MQTDLRPMSMGEILDRTAQLYRTHFLLFAGISAVNAGILLVINLGQLGLNELLLHLHMTKQLPFVTIGFVVLIVPVIVVCDFAAVAANNRAVAWVNLGQPATIVGAYRSILPRLGRYLWLAVIVGFIIYTPFMLIFGAYTGFLFLYVKPHKILAGGAAASGSGMAIFGLVTLALFVVAMAWVIYAILMGLRYSLSIPACVVEDIPARKAIRRSIELSKGSRGRIFMLGLLIAAIQIGLVVLTQLFFLVAMFTAAKNHTAVPLWIQVTQQLVGFLTNSFIGPMYATGLTLFYYDQRIRKEGFDIEWMMEAAGMTALPTPGALDTGTIAASPAIQETATIEQNTPDVNPEAEAPKSDPVEGPTENPAETGGASPEGSHG